MYVTFCLDLSRRSVVRLNPVIPYSGYATNLRRNDMNNLMLSDDVVDHVLLYFCRLNLYIEKHADMS